MYVCMYKQSTKRVYSVHCVVQFCISPLWKKIQMLKKGHWLLYVIAVCAKLQYACCWFEGMTWVSLIYGTNKYFSVVPKIGLSLF